MAKSMRAVWQHQLQTFRELADAVAIVEEYVDRGELHFFEDSEDVVAEIQRLAATMNATFARAIRKLEQARRG